VWFWGGGGGGVFLATDKIICYFTYTAHSFFCYKCGVNGGESHSKEACEKVQILQKCSENLLVTCFKESITKEDGSQIEKRGCELKSSCEARKKRCDDDAEKKKLKIKECETACCISDSETPCNGAIRVSANMMTIMLTAVVCGLRLI